MIRKRIKSIAFIYALVLLLPIAAQTQSGDDMYNKARDRYNQFWTDEDAKANIANWRKLIGSFESVYKTYPNSPSAPKAYFMVGKLSYYAFKYHRQQQDFDRGVASLTAFIRIYPGSNMCDDSYYYLGELYLKAGRNKDAAYYYSRVIRNYPNGDMYRDSKQRLEQLKYWPLPGWVYSYKPGSAAPTPPPQQPPPPPVAANPLPKPLPPNQSDPEEDRKPSNPIPANSGRVIIKDIKYFSSGTYSRVIIYCKDKVVYGKPNFIPPDPANGIDYPRLFIDINDARIAPGAGEPAVVNDGHLRRIRAGQNTPSVVRVVLDIDSIDPEKTKIIPMEEENDDFKIVIDVSGKHERKPAELPNPTGQAAVEVKRIRKIVIDPGHGGKDSGAIGPTGVMEKDVVLKLALLAAERLDKKSDFEILLTRKDDRFLSLEERTAYANVAGADVFVSIHANAHPNKDARGIETYLLDTTNDKSAKRLAAVENRVSLDALDTFQKDPLLFTLFQKAKADESFELARLIQKTMIEQLRKDYEDILDHGVKEAPFFVLMGATMPCVLIETSFISNPDEEKRLSDKKYLGALANSIIEGILEFESKRARGAGTNL